MSRWHTVSSATGNQDGFGFYLRYTDLNILTVYVAKSFDKQLPYCLNLILSIKCVGVQGYRLCQKNYPGEILLIFQQVQIAITQNFSHWLAHYIYIIVVLNNEIMLLLTVPLYGDNFRVIKNCFN